MARLVLRSILDPLAALSTPFADLQLVPRTVKAITVIVERNTVDVAIIKEIAAIAAMIGGLMWRRAVAMFTAALLTRAVAPA